MAAWHAKPGLAGYYRQEIFARLVAALGPGPTLELGSGPGLFAAYHPNMVTCDIVATGSVQVCADAHALPFAPASFGNVAGIDVLHHLARPGVALAAIAQVLKPGGRLVLVEPWAGPFGWLIYRFLHHEDCRRVADPWRAAMPPDKPPLEGNAMIPKMLLAERVAELAEFAPGLLVRRIEHFGWLSYLSTGGFQRWGAPAAAIRALVAAERRLPVALKAWLSLRALFVVEKCTAESDQWSRARPRG